mgnify:CR=1 FL=1
MKNLLIISILSALAFAGCSKKNRSDDASAPQVAGMPAPTAKISAEYEAFAASADSLLNALDAQVEAYYGRINSPGRRRHVVSQRREVIQARYHMDKLRERLQKRSRSYQVAVGELNRIEKDNPEFIKHYESELHELERTVAVLLRDTLH